MNSPMFASSLSDCRPFPSLKSKIKRIISILFCHMVVRVDTNDSLSCIEKVNVRNTSL